VKFDTFISCTETFLRYY